MNKTTLRARYKALRATLDSNVIEEQSMAIANNALTLPIWKHTTYHVFLPIVKQHEVDTEFILHILQGKDKNIVLSKSNFENHSLSHILLTDSTILQTNAWGIPEPTAGIPIGDEIIDVVFIPLLAFDHSGNRVGYGKGFYDQFLAKCRPNTLKIGLSFFLAEEEIEGILPTDISLDYCITPSKIYSF